MSLTANDLILLAVPWVIGAFALTTVYFSQLSLRRRRAKMSAERDDARSTTALPVVVQLTVEDSAAVRKMLERDIQSRDLKDRPVIVSASTP